MVIVEVQGLDELIQRFQQKRERIVSEVERAITTQTTTLAGWIRGGAPHGATNKLANSIRQSVQTRTKETPKGPSTWIKGRVGIGLRLKYTRWVEFGTLTTKWRKMPPLAEGSAFSQWARSKGIDPYVAAFGIVRMRTRKYGAGVFANRGNTKDTQQQFKAGTYRVNGTEPHPFIYPAWDAAKEPFKAAVERALVAAINS